LLRSDCKHPLAVEFLALHNKKQVDLYLNAAWNLTSRWIITWNRHQVTQCSADTHCITIHYFPQHTPLDITVTIINKLAAIHQMKCPSQTLGKLLLSNEITVAMYCSFIDNATKRINCNSE